MRNFRNNRGGMRRNRPNRAEGGNKNYLFQQRRNRGGSFNKPNVNNILFI